MKQETVIYVVGFGVAGLFVLWLVLDGVREWWRRRR